MPVQCCGCKKGIASSIRLDVVDYEKGEIAFSFVVPPAGTAVRSC